MSSVRTPVERRSASIASAFDELPVPWLLLEAGGAVRAANVAFAQLLGHASPGELAQLGGGRIDALFLQPLPTAGLFRRLDAGEPHATQDCALRHVTGNVIWAAATLRRLELDGEPVYECFLQDITARRQREQQLLDSEHRYRLIAEFAAEGVYLAHGDILAWVSDGFAALVGSERDALAGRSLRELVAEQSWAAVQIERRAQGASRDGARFRASLLRQDDGRALPVDIHERAARSAQGTVTVGVIRDLTKQLESERSLAHDALHDPLTGLPNRKYFVEKLRERMEPVRGGRRGLFAVLFIDLDNFKLVNDAHGHGVGDEFLLKVAARLKSALRETDLLARHGGDEFTVLIDNVDGVDDVVALAERLQECLAAAPLQLDAGIYASSSIGIVMDSPGYQTPEEMLRDADTAMYEAKARGRAGYAVFDGAMLQAARSRLVLDSELRHASNHARFVNHYQPIFDSDGRCTGAEALIRWLHPARGVLAPGEFLDSLEESAMCLPVYRKVIADACDMLRRLLDAGLVTSDFSVSVNISARHLLSGKLMQDLTDHLDRCELDKRQLVIEIVETVLTQHPFIGAEILRLKNAGFTLAVDDFGVGTSSLSVIRDLPVDIVKIDQSFLAAIEGSERNARFLAKILEIAHVLGVRTVAEGVETPEHRAFLAGTDCGGQQGFLLARPMPPVQFEAFVREHAR